MATQLVSLYLKSIEGVAQQFKEFFPDKITRVVDVANNAHMRQIIMKYTEVEFPYFALQLTSSNITRDDALPAKNLRRVGAVGGLNSAKTARVVYHILPNTTSIRVVFVTNDAKQLYDFIQRWHIATLSCEMNFKLEASDYTIPINLILDESLSIPELETDDVGPTFMLETNINVDTFIGESEEVSIIRSINTTASMAGETVATETFTRTTDLVTKRSTV